MPMHMFPDEEELVRFEKIYAGPQTDELEKRVAESYVRYRRSRQDRNNLCLICLSPRESEDSGSEDSYFEDSDSEESDSDHFRGMITCKVCPRVLHTKCIRYPIRLLTSKTHCPPCCKRGWHIIEPARVLEHLEGDNLRMKRCARKAKWDKKSAKNNTMKAWMKLHDDGSLESDRQLLVDLGLIEAEQLEAARIIMKEEDDQDDCVYGRGEGEDEDDEEIAIIEKPDNWDRTSAARTSQSTTPAR